MHPMPKTSAKFQKLHWEYTELQGFPIHMQCTYQPARQLSGPATLFLPGFAKRFLHQREVGIGTGTRGPLQGRKDPNFPGGQSTGGQFLGGNPINPAKSGGFGNFERQTFSNNWKIHLKLFPLYLIH